MEAQCPQGDISEGQRLMIIKLERYNKIRELLICIGTTGLQGHIHYQDRVQRVSVTMVALHMGVEEMGLQTKNRGTYNQPPSQELGQVHIQPLQSNAYNKMEID